MTTINAKTTFTKTNADATIKLLSGRWTKGTLEKVVAYLREHGTPNGDATKLARRMERALEKCGDRNSRNAQVREIVAAIEQTGIELSQMLTNWEPRVSAAAKRAQDKYGEHPAQEGENLCLCGCGTAVPAGRKFAQGHDARLAGIAKAAFADHISAEKLTQTAAAFCAKWIKKLDDETRAFCADIANA